MNEESYSLESFDKTNFQPMYRDSVYESSHNSVLILPNIKESNPAEDKNKKLVSLLRSKLFKGYEKIRKRENEENVPESAVLRVNQLKFTVRWKSRKDKVKSKTEKEISPFQITNFNNTFKVERNRSEESQKNFFITDKPKNEVETKEEVKDGNVFNKLFNNYPEEAKIYNLLNFKPFEIKRPNFKIHYNNVNKKQFENDMLHDYKEEEDDEMAKTSKSDFLFRISRPAVNEDKAKRLNFMTNPALFKNKPHPERPKHTEENKIEGLFFQKTKDRSMIKHNINLEPHTIKLKKKAMERESLNIIKNEQKIKKKYFERKEFKIYNELSKGVGSRYFEDDEIGRISNPITFRPRDKIRQYKFKNSINPDLGSNIKKSILDNNKRFNKIKELVMGASISSRVIDEHKGRDMNVLKIMKMIDK
jgi:hypothetical protein